MRVGGIVGSVPRERQPFEGELEVAALSVPRRVVVVDDHTTFADLLRGAVDADPGLECVGVAYDLAAGVALVAAERPDVVVMDVRFHRSERDGLSATAEITRASPDVAVVVLTGHADTGLIRRGADAGACALVPKDGSVSYLMTVLRTARRGGLVVHPDLMRDLVTGALPERAQYPPLSRRERDVLGMLTIGLDARAISHQLGISVHTCRGYVRTLLSKLNAHSQLEAVATARRLGLLDAESLS